MHNAETLQLIKDRIAEGYPIQFANGLRTAEQRLHQTETMMRKRAAEEAAKPVRFRTFAKPTTAEI